MEKETMYWLFTTAPQAIAALVGIIFTGMFFMAESIDNRAKEDQTLIEIVEAAKKALYKNMRVVAILSIITIIYDLVLVGLVETIVACDSLAEWTLGLFVILNISTIYVTFKYVFQTVNPSYFNKIANNLSKDYKTGDVKSEVFINHYIKFERAARDLAVINQMNARFTGIRDLLRILVSNGIITPEDEKRMMEISKIRNLIVHGEKIEKVSRSYDEELQRITNIIYNNQ